MSAKEPRYVIVPLYVIGRVSLVSFSLGFALGIFFMLVANAVL